MTEWNPTLLTYDSAFRNFADPLLTFIGSNGENKEKKRENLRFPNLHHLTHSWSCCEEDEWEHACKACSEMLGLWLAFLEKKIVKVLVAQSCLTLWDPMGCSPPGSSVLENSPGKNTGVCCHAVAWRDLPNPAVQPRCPALQVDSLQSEPPGKPYLCCSVYGSSFIFMAH